MKQETKTEHAIVTRDGYEVPLIGVPKEAVLESCDCCGDIIGLSKSVFTGRQILCAKCGNSAPQPCPIPTDPKQQLEIICAHCGVKIDFRRSEVFSNGISFICSKCSAKVI